MGYSIAYAIAYAAAAAGASVATAVAIAVVATNFIIGIAISFALNAISGAIFGSGSKGGVAPGFSQKVANRLATIRQPITTHRVIYGETRISGPLTFYTSTEDNRYHHMVIPLASHQVDDIGTIWVNDYPIHVDDIDSGGNVIAGRFNGKLRIKKHLGDPNQLADMDLVTEVSEWTTEHRGREIAYIYARIDFDREIFPTGLPTISAVVKGKLFFDPRDSSTRWSPNSVLATYDYLNNARFGRNTPQVELDNVSFNSGANTCEEMVTTQDDPFVISSVTVIKDSLAFDDDVLPFQRGDQVQLTTTGTLPAGISLATNYYIIPDFTHKTDSRAVAIKLASNYIDSLSGIVVDITGVGSGVHTVVKKAEPRYTTNGAIDTVDTPVSILQSILTALAGTISHVGDTWVMKPGVWVAPTIELSEDDVIEAMRCQTRLTKESRANQVIGIFSSPLNQWQPSDYPLVKNNTYVTQDNGEVLLAQLDLQFTSRSIASQRIANIALERARKELALNSTLKLTALQVQAGDNVQFTFPRWSFASKNFEIQESNLVVELDDQDIPIPKVKQVYREIESAVFDWSSSQESSETPETILVTPNPYAIPVPTGVFLDSGTASLFTAGDGTVVSRIKVTWDAVINPFIAGYEVKFKKSTEALYENGPGTFGNNLVFIGPVQDGVDYDVQVTAIGTQGGVKSSPATSLNHTVIGKTAPPSDVTSFNFEAGADGTRIYSWTHVDVPDDVRAGGGYRIRYKLGVETDWGAMTNLHGQGVMTVSPFEDNQLAAGTYTLAIKAIDSSGNESTNAVFIASAVLPNPRIGNALVQRNERVVGWDGVKVDCFVNVDGNLEATGNGDYTNLPATYALLADKWNEIIPNNSPITYTTPEIDLGSDFVFTPLVSILADGTVTATMQTGTDADGSATGSFVTLGKVTARYIKIKISVAGSFPLVSSMVTILDAPATTEDFADIDISDTTANIAQFEQVSVGRFKIETKGGLSNITSAKISAIQGLSVAGYTWALLSKDTTLTSGSSPAAEFIVWDETQTPVNAIVDIELKGSRVG